MKKYINWIFLILFTIACKNNTTEIKTVSKETKIDLAGTWKLVYGEIKENDSLQIKDLSNTDFIKIINQNHFAFFNQNKGTSEGFYAGGGTYKLNGNVYTEKLQYTSAKAIRDHVFSFKIKVNRDTLIQFGKEEVKAADISRDIVEKYIRIK